MGKEFVKYVADNGELETADMFNVEDLVVERPEGLELNDTEVKETSRKGEAKKTKDVTKKVKGAVKTTKVKDDKKVEKPSVSKQEKTLETNSEPVEDAKAQEKRLREEFTTILNNLISGSEVEHCFPSSLNSFERKLVHEIAEDLNLSHESRGEKEKRFILVKKPKSMDSVEKIGKVENQEKPAPKNTNFVVCSNCQKEVPKQNIELHKVHCGLRTLELVSNREVLKDKKRQKGKGEERKKE